MLSENKFGKYSLYAIGEIVLVVIGILIALQINTWNQEKTNRKLETKILKELNQNLENDLDEIKSDISLMDDVQIACINIINDLKNSINPSDKFQKNVSKLKMAPHFDPNKSGYEFLQSKEVDIITNDSLREMISNHYELYYPYYNKYENERMLFKIHQTNDFLMKNFTWLHHPDFGWWFEISNEDYLKIRSEDSFEKIVAATAWENQLINDRAKRIEQQIKNLIQIINEELEINK